ncbi:MAG TPA: N-formylglutamate deformylase [Usitatibacter sp.]|nr:N-formylglutamate deformylase [Usitatibacter sp.]
MMISERTVWPYAYRRGNSPLVVSMPHVGTFIPHSIGRGLSDCAVRRPDTDWHLPRLYDFLGDIDATVIAGTYSRYVVDLNRPPDGSNLYPGQDTPRLCPIDTFRSEPLYRDGEPGDDDIERRMRSVWQPYHRRLRRELDRARTDHGIAILWDAHSITSEVPRLFEGRLPDLNFGTSGGDSCDASLTAALTVAAARHPAYSSVVDGRFKGGFITRAYGDPAGGVHAVQLEMAERNYMDEESPYTFRGDLAARIRPVLRDLLVAALAWAAPLSTSRRAAR